MMLSDAELETLIRESADRQLPEPLGQELQRVLETPPRTRNSKLLATAALLTLVAILSGVCVWQAFSCNPPTRTPALQPSCDNPMVSIMKPNGTTMRLVIDQGKTTLQVHDAQGRLLYSGACETREEREQMPEPYRTSLAQLSDWPESLNPPH